MQRPDSGLVAAIERAAGGQELPSVALAVLAARGDPHARAAFARLLEDGRPWVREWARSAAEEAGISSH